MLKVSWEPAEGCHIVYQDDVFIYDTEDLHEALGFAFGVRDATNAADVIVTEIEVKE